jgi:hypothetical protein
MKTELEKGHERKMIHRLKELEDEARTVRLGSVTYWQLRCLYREKMDDPTYSDEERRNAGNLHYILSHR